MDYFLTPKKTLSYSAIALVSACGGGTTSAVGGGTTSAVGGGSTSAILPIVAITEGPSEIGLFTEPQTLPIRQSLSLDGEQIAVSPDDRTLVNGRGAAYLDETAGRFFAINQGDAVFAVAAGTDDLTDFGVASAFGRLFETELPTMATAQFDGGYIAVVFEDFETSDQEASDILIGDARLNIDFATGAIDGSISNREDFFPDGSPYPDYSARDLVIDPSTVSVDGLFETTVSEGEYIYTGAIPETWTSSDGMARGIVGGPNGEAIAGIVNLTHTVTSDDGVFLYTERGTFVARSD